MIPEFWKSTLEDINQMVAAIQKGRAEIAAHSPGGYPIYLIQYGEANDYKRMANYNSAVGARSLMTYADKARADIKPVILLTAGCHGGEFEGIVALLNLMSIFETGYDFAGNKNPILADWPKHAHIVMIPCVNPDGRARVPVRSVVGMDFMQFRIFDQGIWKDDTICDWPEVKRIHPIKEHVKMLGGYFNDDGVNIMHDNYFMPMAEETKVIIRAASEYAPDIAIDFHGQTAYDSLFLPNVLASTQMLEEMERFSQTVQEACAREDIPFTHKRRETYPPRIEEHQGIGITAAIHFCSGAYSMIHESQQGVINVNRPGVHEGEATHESIYREHMIVLEQVRHFSEEIDRKHKSKDHS